MKINIKDYIKEVPNFPKRGIVFKDISPIMKDPMVYKETITELSKHSKKADVIVSPDARGFLFGAPVAMEINKPFVMARKPGKLAGEVISAKYDLEYGTNELQMLKGSIKPGQRVLIIDDILATGGTVNAIIDLVKQLGGEVIGSLYVAELSVLKGKDKLKNKNVEALAIY